MPDRNIGIKVDEDTYKQIKIKVAQEGITLKEYVLALIKKDLEAEKK